MIILNEIVEKLNNILNGRDPETATIQRPTDLEFHVETPGFHLDYIHNAETNKNFIPVFVSSMGGQINAVPSLKQVDATIPLIFYFPVRFKNVFFALNDYLADVFVGKTLNYGTYSGRAISNISFARYGEIQGFDLKEFKNWVGTTFQREIEVSEPFLTMEISLYLSTSNSEFIYGNNVKITHLVIKYKGQTMVDDSDPICIDRVDVGSCEPAVQQLFSDRYSKGFAANAGFTRQIPLTIKNNLQYRALLSACEGAKDLQNLTFELTEEFPIPNINGDNLTVTNKYFITNYTRRVALGQLLGANFTLSLLREE